MPTAASRPAGAPFPVQGVINGHTRLYAHIGDPIDIVRSPWIYNPWFLARGIDASLVPMSVSRDRLGVSVEALRHMANVHGLIVTMPHKVAIVSMLDSASDAVRAAGSCNAVVKRPDGSLHGDLFDGTGFVQGISRKGFTLQGARCLVIGAGGVGSAIVAALAAAGAGWVRVFDPATETSSRLVARVAAAYPATRVETGSNDPEGFALVVNASPLGMRAGDPLPVDASRLSPQAFVAEVVMKPALTPFLAAAQAQGLRYQPGVDMLYEQIPLYLEMFGHGRPPPDELRTIG